MHPWILFQGGFLPTDAERVCKHHSKGWGLQKIKTLLCNYFHNDSIHSLADTNLFVILSIKTALEIRSL